VQIMCGWIHGVLLTLNILDHMLLVAYNDAFPRAIGLVDRRRRRGMPGPFDARKSEPS
jgi:hypothetical protein